MSINAMARIIIKNLFKKPATQMYPVVKKEYGPNTRGRIQNRIEECIYCGMCQRKCPTGAIEVNRAEKLWKIDPMRCITCNYCVEVCPKKTLSMHNEYTAPLTRSERA